LIIKKLNFLGRIRIKIFSYREPDPDPNENEKKDPDPEKVGLDPTLYPTFLRICSYQYRIAHLDRDPNPNPFWTQCRYEKISDSDPDPSGLN